MITTLLDVLPPLTRPLLGFDLETTGVSATDRIVEIGIEIMMPGKPTHEYRTLINPGIPIPPGATAIHGITDADVAKAPRFEQLADNLLKGFTDSDFAGFNIRFDLKFMMAEFRRARRTWSYESARIVDGFRLWQVIEQRSLDHAWAYWVQGSGPDALTQEDILRTMGEGKSHSALWDVKRSTRVIASQLARHTELPRDLQALHDLCWPGWFDAEGKLQWREGQLCIAFGEHRDKPLSKVPESYLDWMLRKDFSLKVKDTILDARKGIYPEPPPEGVTDGNEQDQAS